MKLEDAAAFTSDVAKLYISHILVCSKLFFVSVEAWSR